MRIYYPGIEVPSYCRQVIHKLQSAGCSAYVVGGAVRDAILGRCDIGDWDVATSARPEEVMNLFPHVVATGLKHGTVTVVVDECTVEVTTFREDSTYSDGRHPDSVVFVDNLDVDLSRRDFTVNALAYDPSSMVLVDLFGGLEDMQRRILRTVGDTRARLSEDRLRMLRAIRFAAVLGFHLEHKLLEEITAGSADIHQVSKERIRDELLGIMTSQHPSTGIDLMRVTGLLKEIIPELMLCTTVSYGEDSDYTVYEHSLTACELVQDDIELRLAALFHDIGKALTCCEGNSADHEKIGAEMCSQLLRRLRVNSSIVETVEHLIETHMLTCEPADADVTIRRFAKLVGYAHLHRFFELRRANIAASNSSNRGCRLKLLHRVKDRVEELITDTTVLEVSGLSIDGNDLLELGFESGPAIGDMLEAALEFVLRHPEKNYREDLLEYISRLASRRIGVDGVEPM